eukprot:2586733-Pyramimonas_sp.AAC.1
MVRARTIAESREKSSTVVAMGRAERVFLTPTSRAMRLGLGTSWRPSLAPASPRGILHSTRRRLTSPWRMVESMTHE